MIFKLLLIVNANEIYDNKRFPITINIKKMNKHCYNKILFNSMAIKLNILKL